MTPPSTPTGPDQSTSPGNRMQIGELAERAGVTRRTIHYSEKLGLIEPSSRQAGGYRD